MTLLPPLSFFAHRSYVVRLQQLMDTFSPKQVLVVFTEHLREQGPEVLAQAYTFLGLDPNLVNTTEIASVAHNAAHTEKEQLLSKLRHELNLRHPSERDEEANLRLRRALAPPNPNHTLSSEMAAELCEVLQPHIRLMRKKLGGIRLPWKTCNDRIMLQ